MKPSGIVDPDASGRRVRGLIAGMQPAGNASITWDLRDDSGHAVGAGLYFAELAAAGEEIVQRFATLR